MSGLRMRRIRPRPGEWAGPVRVRVIRPRVRSGLNGSGCNPVRAHRLILPVYRPVGLESVVRGIQVDGGRMVDGGEKEKR